MRSVSIAASAAALFAALAAAAPSPLVVRSTSLDGSCGNAYGEFPFFLTLRPYWPAPIEDNVSVANEL